jgi:hypothetical protein
MPAHTARDEPRPTTPAQPCWRQPDVLLLDLLWRPVALLLKLLLLPLLVVQTTLLTWLWVRGKLTRTPDLSALATATRERPPSLATRFIVRPLMTLLFAVLVVPFGLVQVVGFSVRWVIQRLSGRRERWGAPREVEVERGVD